ncbi:MAG: hypothetical protein WCX74_02660 [Candidatus Paceibacterota bacterium]
MNNISKEATEVLESIRKYGPVRSAQLFGILNISMKTLYKHLSILLDNQLIKKIGTTPKVFYVINDTQEIDQEIIRENDYFIEQNYIYVSPSGEIVRGVNGFKTWCQKNSFDFNKEKILFSKKYKEMNKLKKNNLISAQKIILSGKKDLSLDEVFFSDFYSFDHFGKTKLGQLVYLGKTSQNKQLIAEIAKLVKPGIEYIISKYQIGLVCFVPPTIDRKVQFLDVLKSNLNLKMSELIAMKVMGSTRIAQKTLRKLEDRIINAKQTIAVSPKQAIDLNVLIIDDAAGSGATLNELAKKIKNISSKKIKVIGYSVVGSFKGFDVISEV